MPRKGYKQTIEHRGNLSRALKGHIITEDTRRKLSIAHKGKTLSKEHIQKLRERKKRYGKDAPMWGRKHSRETIEKMIMFRTGRKMLDEWHQTFGERQMGEKNHRWKGGIKTCDGYKLLLMPGHPLADKKGYVREHRLVAATALGRPLKKNELVHHVNGIKTDNRNRNLLICDWTYHNWLEQRMSYLYKKEHFQCQ